jgi:hypothetical protein
MDTAGFFARDPSLFTKIARVWYGGEGLLEGPFDSLPPTILNVVDYTLQPAAQAIYDAFLANVSSVLGLPTTYFNLTEAWSETSGTDTTIGSYLKDVS